MMSGRSGVLRYIFVCVFCVLIYSLGIYNSFYKADFKTVLPKTENSEKEVLNYTVTQPKINEQTNQIKADETTTKEEESVAKPVMSGAYKGKVISQYISPYSAKTFYSKVYMKNSTGVSVDIKKLLNANLGFEVKKNDEVQVLIIHTHTTESFLENESDYYTEDFSSRSRNQEHNMIKIGSIICEKLNGAGIKTIHDKTEHDYPEYSGSYTRASTTIKSQLKKHPSIKIVLDLHRDAVSSGKSDKVKLVTEINGKKAAQVMLVMGSNTGSVSNFPNWQENLKLAIKLQQKMEEMYPSLARPLSLVSKNYNESLTSGSMLIEFGTDVNTIDEVCASAEYVADALIKVLE